MYAYAYSYFDKRHKTAEGWNEESLFVPPPTRTPYCIKVLWSIYCQWARLWVGEWYCTLSQAFQPQ